MCSTHWPKLIDLTRDEAKRNLRRLELDAYASVITAFRAQSDLTKEKKQLLQQLQATLSISTERHKAEVRRAVNDEKLTTIADHMSGPNVSAEWLIEGRRLVPLMPRLVPQTAFTVTADLAASAQAEKNLSLPLPGQTGKDIYAPPVQNVTNPIPTATKSNRPQSPPSNVVVLPSGMSIHIKGGVSSEEEESLTSQRRGRRSSSADNYPFGKTPMIVSTVAPTPTAAAKPSTSMLPQNMKPVPVGSGSAGSVSNTLHVQTTQQQTTKEGPDGHLQSPQMRMSVARSPGKSSTTTPLPQKVVMVTSAYSGSSMTPHHYQKPGINPRAVSMVTSSSNRPGTPSSTQLHVGSVSMTSSTSASHSSVESLKNIVSVTTPISSTASSVILSSTNSNNNQQQSTLSQQQPEQHLTSQQQLSQPTQQHTPHHHTPQQPHIVTTQRMMTSSSSGTVSHPRTRTIITRPRPPYIHHHHQQQNSGTIYRGTNPGSGQGTPQIIKSSVRPTIHIKQEGGMKIITHSVPGAGPKYITKHSSIQHSTAGSNVVVVTTVPSNITRMTTTAGGKIVNVSAQSGGVGTRVISATRQTGSNMVTVNPKSFHISTVKNVHPTTGTQAGGPRAPTAATSTGGSKPSLIVVHKSGVPHGTRKIGVTPVSAHGQQIIKGAPKTPPGATQSPFEKELMSFIQRQDSQHRQILQQRGHVLGERRIAPKTEGQPPQAKKITVVRQKADGTTSTQPVVVAQAPSHGSKSSILAELIHSRQQEGDMMIIEDQQAVAAITTDSKDGGVQNQWVEMDAPLDQPQIISTDSGDASAIKALLDLQSGAPKVRVQQRVSSQGQQQQQQQVQSVQSDVITIDTSGNIVQQIPEGVSEDNTVQYIQSEHGPIQQQPTGEYLTESGQPVQIELTSEEELAQMGNVISQEIIGELDPNTGILYTSTPFEGQTVIDTGAIQSITPINRHHQTTTSSAISVTSAAVLQQPQQQYPPQQQNIIIAADSDAGDVLQQQQYNVAAAVDSDSAEENVAAGEKIMQIQAEKSTGKHDFLSTALDSAQINLDPYQFMEEDGQEDEDDNEDEDNISQDATSTEQDSVAVPVSSVEEDCDDDDGTEEIEEGQLDRHMREPTLVRVVHHPIQNPATRILDAEDFQPQMQQKITEMVPSHTGTFVKSTTQKVQTKRPMYINLQETGISSPQVSVQNISRIQPQWERCIEISDSPFVCDSFSNSPTVSIESITPTSTSAAVAVESIHVDPTALQMGEFTSQRLDENVEAEANYSSEEQVGVDSSQQQFTGRLQAAAAAVPTSVLSSPSAGSSQDSLSDSMNKRKRKAPPKPDEIIMQSQIGGWVRLALGLLQRVSKYRGLYKQKGEMNAASWFTHPVNPDEVPDYYNIIQTPMDLSTIKRKLELGQYHDWNDFHADMMLIRDNCYQYNPQGSEVRIDCDEVFAFYIPEYDKALQKWHQSQMGSPSNKKSKLDRSPVKTQPVL